MTMPINVRSVRDVRAVVRALNGSESLAAVAMCGTCGTRPTWAGAGAGRHHAALSRCVSRAYTGSRTSRTRRTWPVPQPLSGYRIPHTPPHSPHMLARARFSALTIFEGNGVGGNNG
ncbi:hypothetical protein D7T50_03860 [Stenotrophomonas maltophilia]|nr:hypothetical protein [Stenotrophomonas maltophilia]MBA0479785.1 hypothetical protein [Stenotrophomonas maltophilia]MBA0488009.1 hypothetical protein [Stenotrophomonas maltophilia]MBA0492070.1 hypothetical protein [Stenotrophomonas maltophilia]